MSGILGHSHPEIVATVCDAMAVLDHVHSSFLSDPVLRFTDMLTLKQRHEHVGDVRGRGLLLGVEQVEDRESRAPARELRHRVSRRCLELGASLNISRRSVANIFRIAPPLTLSRDQIDTAISILDQALTECAD